MPFGDADPWRYALRGLASHHPLTTSLHRQFSVPTKTHQHSREGHVKIEIAFIGLLTQGHRNTGLGRFRGGPGGAETNGARQLRHFLVAPCLRPKVPAQPSTTLGGVAIPARLCLKILCDP